MQLNIKELFKALQRERGIAPEVLHEALEAAMASAYKKTPDARENAIARLDIEAGTLSILDIRTVVEGEIEDPLTQIALDEAQEHDPEIQPGQEITIDVTPPASEMGRLAAQMAKQVLNQRLREADRKIVMDQFKGKEGETIIGTVGRLEGRNIIVSFGKAEGIVPGSEQVPGEHYRVGDRIKVFLIEVRETTRGMQLLCSRAHPGLVRELFELEIPEIMDGTVTIEAIAREAGYRTKIAVRSRDASVDPVGACVGARGGRIQGIVSELKNEKIDIIRWSEDPVTFISNSLSPAKVVTVQVSSLERTARVIVPDAMLSLAIGREGQNVRLAARLTGYKIDIKSESQQREISAAQLSEAMDTISEPRVAPMTAMEQAFEAAFGRQNASEEATSEEAVSEETILEEVPAPEVQEVEDAEEPRAAVETAADAEPQALEAE
jgi:N utilization substance protein A